jgi:hypothetical protein
MNRDRPRCISGGNDRAIPHRSTSDAFALLIRVAVGLDDWAERDQRHGDLKGEK